MDETACNYDLRPTWKRRQCEFPGTRIQPGVPVMAMCWMRVASVAVASCVGCTNSIPAITIPRQQLRMDLASSSLVSDARMSMRVITMNLQPSLAPAITIPAQVVRMSRQPITTQRSPWTMALVNSLVASSREHAISIPMRMSTTGLASTSRVSILVASTSWRAITTLRQPLQTAHACSLALSVTMETTKRWMM